MKDMGSHIMPEDEALRWHFGFRLSNGRIEASSGFVGALRDAREATGRDVNSGEKLDGRKERRGCWLGALGYMALLDQIGKCFKPRSKERIKDRPIIQGLRHFTALSTDESGAIYALRCGFAHDYSLVNDRTKPELTHHFFVYANGLGPVVTLPKERWSGDSSQRTLENRTCVNLEAFGDLVEGVYAVMRDLLDKGELEIILSDGSDELLWRYHFTIGEMQVRGQESTA
jgi:hypothetical protein